MVVFLIRFWFSFMFVVVIICFLIVSCYIVVMCYRCSKLCIIKVLIFVVFGIVVYEFLFVMWVLVRL